MRKSLIILVVLPFLLFSQPIESIASLDASGSSLSQDTWDWLTTLGKSPQEKKKIMTQHLIERNKKRMDKELKSQKAAQIKANKARAQEAARLREAQIKAKRKRSEELKRQIKEEERQDKNYAVVVDLNKEQETRYGEAK
jgi:hypothetical protein